MRSLSGFQEEEEEWAIIRAGLDDLKKRVDLLPRLKDKGFEEEALLLCCCYIEAIGNVYYRQNRTQYNFCRILREFGQVDVLHQIHPKQLWIGLKSSRSSNLQRIGHAIGGTLKRAQRRLYSEAEILGLVGGMLGKEDTIRLKDNLWRGTLAALAYQHLRNPAVHEMGGAKSFQFEGTTFKGDSVPDLNFSLLYKSLLKVLNTMRRKSDETRTYFGLNLDTLLRESLAIHKEWDELT